jgi:hypothetical protein
MSAMKPSIVRICFLAITFVLTWVIAIIPTAYAQIPSPGGASLPIMHLALFDPGPMGQATTTNMFAQVAIGGGNITVFSFLNATGVATTGNLILTADNGTALQVSLSTPGSPTVVTSNFPFSIPSGGSQVMTLGPVNPNDPTSAGWGRVESSGGLLDGVATFQFFNGTVLSYIAGVLSANPTPAATIPVDDDRTVASATRSTGYAVANPGSTPINVQIVLLNPDGTEFQRFNPPALNPLPARHHIAEFLWQDLNNPALQFRGNMVLIEQTGTPFAVVALVQNQALYTVIPVSPNKPPAVVYR